MKLRRVSGTETPTPFDAVALAGATLALLLGIVGAGLRAVGELPWSRPALGPATRVIDATAIPASPPSRSIAARAAQSEGSVVLGRRVTAATPSPAGGSPTPGGVPGGNPNAQWQPRPRPDIRPVENPPQDPSAETLPPAPPQTPAPPAPVPSPSPTESRSPTPTPSQPSVSPSPPSAPGEPEPAEPDPLEPGAPGNGNGNGPPEQANNDKDKVTGKGKEKAKNSDEGLDKGKDKP